MVRGRQGLRLILPLGEGKLLNRFCLPCGGRCSRDIRFFKGSSVLHG